MDHHSPKLDVRVEKLVCEHALHFSRSVFRARMMESLRLQTGANFSFEPPFLPQK